MSGIDVIQSEIADTQRLIERHELLLAKHPKRRSLAVTIGSLRKHQQQLEAQFAEMAERLQFEVCAYRIFSDNIIDNSRELNVFPKVLSLFQEAYSLSFDAVRRGPRTRRTLSDEVRRKTALSAGYSFTGSMGIVLTTSKSHQKQLFGSDESDNYRAIHRLFDLLNAKNEEDIREASAKLGLAVVRCVAEFAQTHAENILGSDIDWRNSEAITDKIFLQHHDFVRLSQVIKSTHDESTKEFIATGLLTAIDVSRKTFKMKLENGTEIHGEFHAEIDTAHTVELPRKYRAVITHTKRVSYATDEVKDSYFMEDLRDIDRLFN